MHCSFGAKYGRTERSVADKVFCFFGWTLQGDDKKRIASEVVGFRTRVFSTCSLPNPRQSNSLGDSVSQQASPQAQRIHTQIITQNDVKTCPELPKLGVKIVPKGFQGCSRLSPVLNLALGRHSGAILETIWGAIGLPLGFDFNFCFCMHFGECSGNAHKPPLGGSGNHFC